jgi:N-acetyl sugar amidotransferase
LDCKNCLYNYNIPAINFDTEEVCNYCRQHKELDSIYPIQEEGRKKLLQIVEEIKADGKNKKYDVVVGVSGGCDSSYLLHLAVELGLRPLAVHYDNTWNGTKAVENIKVITDKLNIDLYTHVADNKEVCSILHAFLKASVPDIDCHTDIALVATHYMAAEKYNVKYIWEGHSYRTEGISPPGWFYMDAKYIKKVYQKFVGKKIKTVPLLTLNKWFKWMLIDKIKKIRPLYYLDYKKEEVKELLKKKYQWQWYGGHHMENRLSYFCNNYYLPQKFQIDLRVCEFSANVRSGYWTKQDAIDELAKPKPFDETILTELCNRLTISLDTFNSYMSLPPKTYKNYPNYKSTFRLLRPIFWILLKGKYITKSFYDKFTSDN